MAASQNGAASNGVTALKHQNHLTTYCRDHGMRPPQWQDISDRRGKARKAALSFVSASIVALISTTGGRTAWSAVVQVQGQNFQAPYWYDGNYVNQAREEAAEIALQKLGQLPARPPPLFPQKGQPPPPQMLAQAQPGPQGPPQGLQPRPYGAYGGR